MVLGVKYPTLLDVGSRLDENGKVAKDIIEILNETNEVLQDMTWVEANDGSGLKTTIRTGLPLPTWRMLNYGVQPTKSTTTQVRDAAGMLEAYAQVDKALIEMSGDPVGFRASEDAAHLEGMNQGFLDTFFYGNSAVNPERFTGLAPRFSTKSGAENGQNIILGGGSGSDNTSVWLVVHGPRTFTGFYPKGSQGGISTKDLGEVTAEDANKGLYQVMRTHYKWTPGVSLRDWRYVVRIANIDLSDLKADASTGANLISLMTQAIELLPPGYASAGRAAFYANRNITSMLRQQIVNKSNVNLSLDEVAGKKVLAFDGIPVRRVDALLNTEALVA